VRGRREAAFAFQGDKVRTNVYVDAFNLYYGSLKGTPYRWLNLEALLRRLLIAGNQLQKIKYCTAPSCVRPGTGGHFLQTDSAVGRERAPVPDDIA
jgi:hypothetical protein